MAVTPEQPRRVDIFPPPWSVEWIRRVQIKCMLFWWRLLYMTECRLLKENKRFPLIPRAPKPQSPDPRCVVSRARDFLDIKTSSLQGAASYEHAGASCEQAGASCEQAISESPSVFILRSFSQGPKPLPWE